MVFGFIIGTVSTRGDIERITSTASGVTNTMDEIMTGIQQGRGPVGKILNDETLSVRIDDTTANLDRASGKVDGIVADFEQRDLLGRVQATLENTKESRIGLIKP